MAGMNDDAIDDWLDSSDDEGGADTGTPQPSTPSFLQETTPVVTPAVTPVAEVSAPVAEAPEPHAEAPAVNTQVEETSTPPPVPAPVSVEAPVFVDNVVQPPTPVADEMMTLSLSPKAESVPAAFAENVVDVTDPAPIVTPTIDESVETIGEETIPAEAMPAEIPVEVPSPQRMEEPSMPHPSNASTVSLGGGDGSDTFWTLRSSESAEELSGASVGSISEKFSGFAAFADKFGDVTKKASAAVRAATGSDLARDTLNSVKNVGKEIGHMTQPLVKHVAGEDLAKEGDGLDNPDAANENLERESREDNTQPQVNPTASDMWNAFGSLAKNFSKTVENTLVQVTNDPNIKNFANKSVAAAKNVVSVVEAKAVDLLQMTDNSADLESNTLAAIADSDGVALESALIERGCAHHLEQLESLADVSDAIAAEQWEGVSENFNFSTFSPSSLDTVDAMLDVERPMEWDDDLNEGSNDESTSGGPFPGEDASELTKMIREDACQAALEAGKAAAIAFREALAFDANQDQQTEPRKQDTYVESTADGRAPRISSALMVSLEPLRSDAAVRVADVTAAIVAHVTDIAASLEAAPGSDEAWPSPPGTDKAPCDIAFARARMIRGRVKAMLDDAYAIADAFENAATGIANGEWGCQSEQEVTQVSNLSQKHASTTSTRLKEVALGYAADSARCLRAVVALSAEDAAAGGG